MNCFLFFLFFIFPIELVANVHAFYYIWYGSPSIDGHYIHWNHAVLPHWEERINRLYSNIDVKYNPPEDIHSIYYPLNGLYSSQDKEIIKIIAYKIPE
jgi:glycoprotein endo-alpha-1,2-mannosidase